MSRITLHNYEAFLLDYSEGNLVEADSILLKAFALAHPELEIDLDDLVLPYVPAEEQRFNFKEDLRRTETEVPDETLLNYLEGNLSPEEHIAFEHKVSRDPELAKDLELYKRTVLQVDLNENAGLKAALLRTEEDLVLNNRMIAYLENQLSSSEKAELESEFLVNAALQKEFGLISKTVLCADLSVVYPDKEALKKENKVIALFSLRTVGSIAAAILLILGSALLYNYYSSDEAIGNPELAGKSSTTTGNENVKGAPSQKQVAGEDNPILKDQNFQAEKRVGVKKEKKEISPAPHAEETQGTGVIEEHLPLAKEQEEEKVTQPPVYEQKTELALNTPVNGHTEDSILNKQNYLLVVEEFEESELGNTKHHEEKGFWKRAVQLARQANKLGVKSVDGQENTESKYRLSFNSFSVGKK